VDPNVVRALQRATAAFLVTFVVGSGVVFAMNTAGDDGTDAASPTPSEGPGAPGDGGSSATTPIAYLLWMPEGFPSSVGEELTTITRVRRVAVAAAGVGWLTRSVDEGGDVVDAPESPFMVPLEITGVDPGAFASFLPPGEQRDLIRALASDQAILSASAAKRRDLGPGAQLGFGELDVQVAGVVPDVLIGGYEVLVTRATAEALGAIPRYALLRMRKGATPTPERLTADVMELIEGDVRDPAVEVRAPGETELLRAYDRSLTPSALKRRFGEFTAYPVSSTSLDVDDAWVDENIEAREVPRLGTVSCHRKTLFLLRKAMAEVPVDADLGDVGECHDTTWTPSMPQGTLPAALWGASIRLHVSVNTPGNPPLLDGRVVETMAAWGFRWAGLDAYPDGSLFEYLHPPPRDGGEGSPSPTD
jgi:hypothetical protein